jgi:(hydroxyamino)benzene mutase
MDGYLLLMGRAGFALFTLGLLLGAVLPKMRNPRIGLSAHLTAVQTGPALIAFALFWQYLAVPKSWTPLLVCALVLSSYILVLGITLAGFTGASEALPIAGKGHQASRLQEQIVTFLVRGSSILMTLSCMAICYFTLANSRWGF